MTKKTIFISFVFILILCIFGYLLFKRGILNFSIFVSTNNEEVPITKVLDSNNTLNLSNKSLEKLPQSVLNNTNLVELNISNNIISGALPAEIKNLKRLKVLNASNNLMTGVPAEVGQLTVLEILDLSNNNLTGLPQELGNLKNLRILNLSGNDYSVQDLEIIKKGLPATVEIVL